jgi:hypothetical protein
MTEMRIRLRVIGVTRFRRDAEVHFTLEIPRCEASGTENVRPKSRHNGSTPCLQTVLPTGDIDAHRSGSITAAFQPKTRVFCRSRALVGDTSRSVAHTTRSSNRLPQQRRHPDPRCGPSSARGAHGPTLADGARRSLRARAARARAFGAVGGIGRDGPRLAARRARCERAPFRCVLTLRLLASPELVWALPALLEASRGAT